MPEWPVTKAAFYWFSCILTWDMTIFRGQAAEAQSSSYCYSTQRHTVKDNYRHYCARRPKYPYYWRGKGGKVSTPSSRNQKIHRTTRVKVIPILIGALGTISGNGKVSHVRLSLPDIFGRARTVVSHPWYCPYLAESVMSLSCRISAETWLRIPRKRTGEDHTIIIIIKLCARSVFLHLWNGSCLSELLKKMLLLLTLYSPFPFQLGRCRYWNSKINDKAN